MNLALIFFTGLTTGGLSCLAMQGGLLTSVIVNQKDQEHDLVSSKPIKRNKRKQKLVNSTKRNTFSLSSFDQLDWMPVSIFLIAKIIAHTILGFFLGLLGSSISLSLSVRLAFQAFTAFFMFATAMNLLDVHPVFRYVVFQPPKFIQRYIRNTAKSQAFFAPGILGALTIFIPCGVTQAMEVLAINSGNPVTGSLIMLVFVLGTSPLFAILGVATAKLSEGWYQKFTKFAAYSLIAMAIYGFNGVLIVMGSPLTVQTFTGPVRYFFSDERFAPVGSTVETVQGAQIVNIQVLDRGYAPNYVKVKSGIPVKLTLTSNGVYSCALSFVFKEFGINTFLKSTDTQSFTFTPKQPGKYTFACSMGMYTGVMEVL